MKTPRTSSPQRYEKQLRNYLRAIDIGVGLRFNFGPTAPWGRDVFENERNNPRNPRQSVEHKQTRSCG